MAKEFVEFNLPESGLAVPSAGIDWLDRAIEMTKKIGEAHNVSGVLHYAGQAVIAQELLESNLEGIRMNAQAPLDNYEPINSRPNRKLYVKNFSQPLFSGQLYFFNYLQTSKGEISLRTLKVVNIFHPAPSLTAETRMRLDENGWPPEGLLFPDGSSRSHAEFRLMTPDGQMHGANQQTPIIDGDAWYTFRSYAALALGTNLSRYC